MVFSDSARHYSFVFWLSIHRLSLSAFKILKNKCAQFIQRRKEGLTVIGFGELLYETLQPGVGGDHKRGDGYLQFLALGGQAHAAVQYLPVGAPAVLIVPLADLQAGGFAIGDHEYLFVGVPPAAQDIHGQFKSRYGIGMIGTNL